MKSTTTHHLLLWFAFLGGLSHPTAAGPRVPPGARTPAARTWERRGSCTGDGHRQWCWGHRVPLAMNLPPRSFLVLWCPSWSCPVLAHTLDSFKTKPNQRVRCRRRADALCQAGGWPAPGDKASRSPCCRTTAVCWERGSRAPSLGTVWERPGHREILGKGVQVSASAPPPRAASCFWNKSLETAAKSAAASGGEELPVPREALMLLPGSLCRCRHRFRDLSCVAS